jgi:hypothetical protein
MKPDPIHVDPLEAMDVEDLAVWLVNGFDLINKSGTLYRHMAFYPLNYFVGRNIDLTGELKNIYDLLSESSKYKFRQAIALAFSALSSTTSVKRSLLHLACRIHALEILSEINQQLNDNYLDTLDPEELQEWFALLVNIVSSMPPGAEVAFTLRNIIANHHFHYNYSLAVLVALCRSEPENFSLHMEYLRKSFIELHHSPGNMINVYMTVRRIKCYVASKILQAYEFQKGDEWLRVGFG